MPYLAAFLVGFIAGMRTFTAPAAVSWAAWAGTLDLAGTSLSFMGSVWTVAVLSLLAAGEFVADKLPKTPSRLKPAPYIARLGSGAFAGACIGTATGNWIVGLILGAIGAGSAPRPLRGSAPNSPRRSARTRPPRCWKTSSRSAGRYSCWSCWCRNAGEIAGRFGTAVVSGRMKG